MKCDSCGAEAPLGAATCEFCGSAIAGERQRQDAARAAAFAAIKRSPRFAAESLGQVLAALPSLSGWEVGGSLLFFAVFIFATVFIGSMMFSMGDEMPPAKWMALVPFGMAALGGAAVVKLLLRTQQIRSAAPLALPAIVASKRTKVSGGGRNSSASTEYFATFEFEDGRRREYTVRDDMFAELAENDPGILFCRADWAVRFERVA